MIFYRHFKIYSTIRLYDMADRYEITEWMTSVEQWLNRINDRNVVQSLLFIQKKFSSPAVKCVRVSVYGSCCACTFFFTDYDFVLFCFSLYSALLLNARNFRFIVFLQQNWFMKIRNWQNEPMHFFWQSRETQLIWQLGSRNISVNPYQLCAICTQEIKRT